MLIARSWKYRRVGRKTLVALGLTKAFFKTLQQRPTGAPIAVKSTVAHAGKFHVIFIFFRIN